MNNMIVPEYKIVGDNKLLPFDNSDIDAAKNAKNDGSKLKVIRNPDGSNGVSLYDDGELIVKTTNDRHLQTHFDKDKKLLDTSFIPDEIKAGNGINVNKNKSNGATTISLQEDYVRDIVVKNTTQLRGENGVLVEKDEKVSNGKVIKLDNNYIIKQGDFNK